MTLFLFSKETSPDGPCITQIPSGDEL